MLCRYNTGGGISRATRQFARKARLALYFIRVPSLPATDDGSARPLADDLSTGPGSSEDITWDADAEVGPLEADAPAATEAELSLAEAEAQPRPFDDDAEPRHAEAELQHAEGELQHAEAEPRHAEAEPR